MTQGSFHPITFSINQITKNDRNNFQRQQWGRYPLDRFWLQNEHSRQSACGAHSEGWEGLMGWEAAIAKALLSGPAWAMQSCDRQSEIIYLIAHERGLPRERVHLSDRLLHDLGMDGYDAVDFFNSVHERFRTDLTHLHEHWSEHFGPEGLSCWYGLAIIPAAVIGGAVAGTSGLSAFWGFVITVTLLAAALWASRRWGPADRTVPITVGEVVAANEVGAWPGRPDG